MRMVFKNFVLTVVLVFTFVGISFSEEKQEKHPIDMWLEKCIEKDPSTTGMINCSNKAYEMWDKELNKVYQELMKKLSPEEKELLKESQKQWLKFKDAEFRFIDGLFLGYGTVVNVEKVDQKYEFLKARVLQLQEYLSQINFWSDDRKEKRIFQKNKEK